ncbi:hypothetical protein BD311DRAFT_840384 [Dichomitus squalens]|uniref:F-box domain-containing protein n=1 Tax=Dichomitus squalens TaxID=114155 RepID=A0A4Q9N4M2_9APHY|nr:hypothetical protein BD311DRAFT_840384 [Dichomitus squalens]
MATGTQEGSQSGSLVLALAQTMLGTVQQWHEAVKAGNRIIGAIEILEDLDELLTRTTIATRCLRNALCPANHLPSEVLRLIFFFIPRMLPLTDELRPSSDRHIHVEDLVPITAVCRYWRDVAVITPSL